MTANAPVQTKSGFTLVEMIVALAVFAIVAVVAVGALVKVVGANRRAQAVQTAVSNVGFVLESMSRELRTGSTYDCSTVYNAFDNSSSIAKNDCSTGGGQAIAFLSSRTNIDPQNKNIPCQLITAYRFNNQTEKGQIDEAMQQNCHDPLAFSPVTSFSSGTTITGFNLIVDSFPPAYSSVLIHVTGTAGVRLQDQTAFNVQTYVSQRVHD